MKDGKAVEEENVGGVPHRLLDGYDGGDAPPDEYVQELLKGAPDHIQKRLKDVASEKQADKPE